VTGQILESSGLTAVALGGVLDALAFDRKGSCGTTAPVTGEGVVIVPVIVTA
jgi:hypothetical protein